jgi:hypothetical protein
MKSIRNTLAPAAGLALVLMLGACDSEPKCTENPTGPGCPVSPPPPTPELPRVIDRGEGMLPAFVALMRPLATTQSGSIEAIVDWTYATNDLDVLLARGTCTLPQLQAAQCAIAAAASGTGTKHEQVRLANQPAGTYTFILLNFGPDDESVSYQVVFTPGTSAASAARGPENVRMDKGAHLRRVLTRLD